MIKLCFLFSDNYALLFFFPTTNFIFFIFFILSFFYLFYFSTRFLHFQKTFGHFYGKVLWNVIKINILNRYLQLSLTKNSIKHILLIFDPFYNQSNISMIIQRVSDEIQEYKYIQFIQFNYFQVMNINFKKLFVYSYCYPIFLYVYIIASQIINFFHYSRGHVFQTLRDQKNLLEFIGVFEL